VRVAVVAEWYPGPADPVHGIWAHRQAMAVAAQGAELQVLALRRPVPPLSVIRPLLRIPPEPAGLWAWAGSLPQQLAPAARDGIRIHAVPWLGPPRPLSYGTWGWWMAFSLGVALDRLRAAWPFELVHAHCLAPAGHATARWVARQSAGERPAFAVSAHGGDMFRVPNTRLGRRAVQVALGHADLVIANSTWAQHRCEELAGGPLASEVVHLGATVAGGAEGAAAAGAGGRRLRLVTVAHLQERKHHHVVLGALACLPEPERPDYLIIGEGEQRARLETLTGELGLTERVTFAGQLPNEQAVARVAACDLLVMPSVEEPFGVAYVEAMAAGVPAIGSRGEGGPQDIVAAGPGMLLVDSDDAAELAALIRRLGADRPELERLGRAARATALVHFTWERCGARTVAAYARAVGLRLGPAHGSASAGAPISAVARVSAADDAAR
jgi:teichuronic acid biosynthesis glycosyltransferase TuaC